MRRIVEHLRTHRVPAVLAVLAFVASGLLAAVGPQREAGFLWVAQSHGLLNLGTDDGAIRFELRRPLGFSGMAINDLNGDVWAYGSKQLHQFSRAGQLVNATSAGPSLHGDAPADMAVDSIAGNLWVAIKRDLYRFDLQGRLEQTLLLPHEVVALALDRERSRLWVALERELRAYDADGGQTARVEVVPLAAAIGPGGGAVQAIRIQDTALDEGHGQLWVALPHSLQRYDAEGRLTFEVAGDFAGALSTDGAGGLWVAHERVLRHVDADGNATVAIEPFAGLADKAIVDLVADPGDASVWVASASRIRHYAVDGDLLHETVPTLGDGTIRRLDRTALYADRHPPEIRIDAPAGGALLATNRPVIGLSYFDLGVGVDAGSIAFSRAGTEFQAVCETRAGGATCVPDAFLPEGRVEIAATVADLVGNRSAATPAAFTIDTIPPAIAVGHPPAGFHTREAQLAISGVVDEPAAVEIDGASLAPDGAGRFTAVRMLSEGSNTLRIVATDRAGNRSELQRDVVLDTVPPAPASVALVTIAEPIGGEASVSGAPGSVEAGATVRVTNARTGATASVVADADGSFALRVAAEPGDELRVEVLDRAGNGSVPLALKVPALLSLAITDPPNGATVPTGTVLVMGAVNGTLNAAVAVNGQPATLVVSDNTLRYYRSILLQPGVNAIAVTASVEDAATLTKTITVTRADTAPRVSVLPVTGMAPLATTFSIAGAAFGRYRVEYDFDGNGSVDATVPSLLATRYTYAVPGVYRPKVRIYRQNTSTGVYELLREQGLATAAFSPELLRQSVDAVLRSVWHEMNAALLAGDVAGALRKISRNSRDSYGRIFRALQPAMADVLDDFTHIEPVALGEGYADYMVLNVRGAPRVHMINFIQRADGVWYIDSM